MRSTRKKARAASFPKEFDDILALPGIGRYTAGAICSIAFNQPTPILDGNVIRVLTRIFGIAENPKEKQTNAWLWQLAEELVARKTSKAKAEHCSHLNQSLMELGALVCTPRNPQCPICPVKKLCVAFKENRMEELPNLGKREQQRRGVLSAFVVERDGKFLVRQRPEDVVNAHLWEFPNVEVNGPKLRTRRKFSNRSSVLRRRVSAIADGKTFHHALPHHAGGVSRVIQEKTACDKASGIWLPRVEI